MHGPSPEFRSWTAERGVALTGSPESLAAIEGRLDEWWRSEAGPSLGNELGFYLGHILAESVPGAHWVAWPNGHPVIRLASGRELDVFDVVRQRLEGRAKSLPEVYAEVSEDQR